MNGTQFWEFKKSMKQTGSERQEESPGLPASRPAVKNRVRNEESYPWQGPGKLWLAESEGLSEGS